MNEQKLLQYRQLIRSLCASPAETQNPAERADNKDRLYTLFKATPTEEWAAIRKALKKDNPFH